MLTTLARRLGLRHPIVQAPMAGGGDTAALVAAVSEAGGLGSIGAAYLAPAEIVARGRAILALTTRPFAINLFAPSPAPARPDPSAALAAVAPFYSDLGLPLPEAPADGGFDFEAQLAAALGSGASLVSFTFGLPPATALQRIRAKGLLIAGTATTPDEARRLAEAGVDIVVTQGGEAGGHRGSFEADRRSHEIGSLALVPQAVDASGLPVIASGGIMDGRGIAAALALGAGAAQLGTAFLVTDEAGIPEAYKAAILAARAEDTRVTRAFSGRPARGIANRFMEAIEGQDSATLPFPLQNALTRPLRTAGAKAGRAEVLSLWAGQGLELSRRLAAADLMAALTDETRAALGRLRALDSEL